MRVTKPFKDTRTVKWAFLMCTWFHAMSPGQHCNLLPPGLTNDFGYSGYYSSLAECQQQIAGYEAGARRKHQAFIAQGALPKGSTAFSQSSNSCIQVADDGTPLGEPVLVTPLDAGSYPPPPYPYRPGGLFAGVAPPHLVSGLPPVKPR